MTDANIKTVQKIYAAFTQGDVATILDQLDNDVDWASEADSGTAPWHGVHKGKGEVPKFFEAIAATMEVTEFSILSVAANDTDVMAIIRFGLRIPATGKQGSMDLHHWWQFTPAGKVKLYRGTEDTELMAALLSST